VYLQHFGLSDQPFRIVPSPKYFFVSDTHDEGRARVLYGIRESRGFVVVTGGVGLGKTTVLLSVVNELEAELDVAIIVNPVDSFDQLLRMICEELGVTVRATDEATLTSHLNTKLLDSYGSGRGCVLLLDEAQNLSIEVLERIRTLSNLQTEDRSLLQIVLVGQPELTTKLNDHRIRQLRQRIGVWHEIQPLQMADTVEYIWHRLVLSGAQDGADIISQRECELIHKYAEGIPRLINQISDTALVVAFGAGALEVGAQHVVEAARELRLEESHVSSPESPQGHRVDRRWFIAAIIVVVVVLLTSAAWTKLSSSFSSGRDGGDHLAGKAINPVSADVVPVPEVVATVERSPAPVVMNLIETAAFPGRYQAVEILRQKGLVYAAYLASFRELTGAQGFAHALMAGARGWHEPLYVEETADRPTWFRVTAGGYEDRAEAVAWARTMRTDLGLRQAQVTMLDPGARALIPSGLRGAEGATFHE
jgi:general secretion pathway protein A